MEKAGEFGAIWRRDISPHLESLEYHVWNPYEQELNVGVDVKDLATLKKTSYPDFLDYCKKIVDYDLQALVTCAAVAVRIDGSVLQGAGTYGELTMSRLFKIPVFAWIDLPNGELDVPGWAMGCITKYSTTKDGFYKSIPPAGTILTYSN